MLIARACYLLWRHMGVAQMLNDVEGMHLLLSAQHIKGIPSYCALVEHCTPERVFNTMHRVSIVTCRINNEVGEGGDY